MTAFFHPFNSPRSTESGDFFEKRRREMVERQIKARDVQDSRVLLAMQKVARHEFVNPQQCDQAYDDHPLPIGEGQTISQPYIVALMAELLSLPKEAKVLEIGTGSGYEAAVLAELAKEVYTVEINPKLAAGAEKTLTRLGYRNVRIKHGDGYSGWIEHAPFDGIAVAAAPERVPAPLLEQLKEGKKLVIPLGHYPNQTLFVLRKFRNKIEEKAIIPVSFVPMTGLASDKPERTL